MKLALTSILFAACSGGVDTVPVAAADTTTQTPSRARVHLEGMHDVDESQLRDVVQVDKLKDPRSKADREQVMRRDELWLLAALYDRGYVQAKVTSSTTLADIVDVTYHVEEGARFHLGALAVHERGSPSALGTFHRAKAGEWFSRRLIVADIDELRALYAEQGHSNAQITPNANIDAQKRTIDLDVVIDPNGG